MDLQGESCTVGCGHRWASLYGPLSGPGRRQIAIGQATDSCRQLAASCRQLADSCRQPALEMELEIDFNLKSKNM